jgi:hypothetical protein
LGTPVANPTRSRSSDAVTPTSGVTASVGVSQHPPAASTPAATSSSDRALLEEHPVSTWQEGSDSLPPPRSFRRLVQDRLAASAVDTRDLVDAAAILGPHCTVAQAATLSGVAEPLPALDEATRRDLLRVSESRSPWTVSFPHPLIRSAVYEAIGAARRHRWHLAAVTLTTDPGEALRHRVAALVPWHCCGTQPIDDGLVAYGPATHRSYLNRPVKSWCCVRLHPSSKGDGDVLVAHSNRLMHSTQPSASTSGVMCAVGF